MQNIPLTSLSRTVVAHDHALITGDGFVNSKIPNWDNCEVNVVINEAMGADFCQLLVTLETSAVLKGTTEQAQIFFYIIEGSCKINIDGQESELATGSYVYIPIGKKYHFDQAEANTKILTFHKVYEDLEGHEIPEVLFGSRTSVEQTLFNNDPNLLMQNLLPDQTDLAFDMAVNIFTYAPGAVLPFVETHIMEHGLLYLEGQGIYRLADQWYPVKKGDAIWMAPYCPQWFGAFGTEPAVYIYYKNVNRFPTII